MVCPFCLYKKTIVYNSRSTARLNALWRRRRCLQCGKQFTTTETITADKILTVKTSGHTAPFSKTQLLLSLAKACDHRNDDAAFWLAETIEQKLLHQAAEEPELALTRPSIVATCLAVLQNFDARAYMKYLSYYSEDDTAAVTKITKKRKRTTS